MEQVVTAKMPKKLLQDIDHVSKTEQVDRSTAMRKLLGKALQEWKEDQAVERYNKGELSTEQAAHAAELSIWKFFDILHERKIPIKRNLEDFTHELDVVKKWKQ